MNALRVSLIAAAGAWLLAGTPMTANATPVAQSYKTASKPAAAAAKPAAEPAKHAQAPADDKTLTERIQARMTADSSLKKFDIDVSVANGVAMLTGKVRTEAEKLRAGRHAHVAGVTRVDNQIALDKDAGKSVVEKVKSTAATAGEKTKSAAETVGEKTKEAAKTVGEKTKEGLSKTGEVITDAWITSKVHTQFVGEDLLKGSDINVDTKDHVVTLRGTVKSAAGRTRAMEIARKTEGVKSVVDRLAIK